MSYFFRREGDTFYLLTDEPIPTLSYDYDNSDGRRENERFYGDVGMGGYSFPGGPGNGPSYTRFYFRLEGNRLVEIDEKRLR